MSRKETLPLGVAVLLVTLLLVGCGSPVSTIVPEPPTATCTPERTLSTQTPEPPAPTPILQAQEPPSATATEVLPATQRTALSHENANQMTQLASSGIGPVNQVAWSPDGAQLAAAAMFGVTLYDVETLINAEEPYWGEALPVADSMDQTLAFSADGTLLACGKDDGTVQLWQVDQKSLIHTLEAHTNRLWQVVFSPDGTLLASGAWDGTIKLWNVPDWSLVRTLEEPGVVSVAFSPDGSLLASGSTAATVHLWNVRNGSLVRTLEGHTDRVSSVAFSPDGTLLASGSYDASVRLWKVKDGSLVRMLELPGTVNAVAFSPDGALLASDGPGFYEVTVWRVADGTPLKSLQDTQGLVLSLSFSPDGTLLASGAWYRTAVDEQDKVRLWGIP